MADDFKETKWWFIPGVRPGTILRKFLDQDFIYDNFPGSLFLSLVAILPAVAVQFGIQQNWACFMEEHH